MTFDKMSFTDLFLLLYIIIKITKKVYKEKKYIDFSNDTYIDTYIKQKEVSR